MSPVRLALTVPSAASLGAFEAGALAALLVAVQRLHEQADAQDRPAPVVVDAVGASSAGSLVGLLGARCLLAALDPVHVLHRAWVEQASWQRLRRRNGDAPLSLVSVERDARGLLDPRDRRGRPAHRAPDAAVQRDPLVLHLDVATLHALAFPVPGVGPTAEGFTHVDGIDLVLRPDDPLDAWVDPPHRSPLAVALASMSHPAVFAPRLLDRSEAEADYRARGITNLPASGHLWCVDGGALVRNPLAATLRAARTATRLASDPTGQATRVHVLLQPHTGGPDADVEWSDPDRRPAWTSSVARLVAGLTPEPLYADLRRIEDVNARLDRARQVVDALTPVLPPEAAPVLADLVKRFAPEVAVDDDPRSLLEHVVAAVGDLRGRERVATEVVSPLRLVEADRARARGQEQVPQLLSGERLGRFGGLLDERLRHSDFVTGWRSTRAWLPDALDRYGVAADDVELAVTAVDARTVEYGRSGFHGGARLSDLPLRERGRLAGTVLHAGHVALRDALSGGRHRERG